MAGYRPELVSWIKSEPVEVGLLMEVISHKRESIAKVALQAGETDFEKGQAHAFDIMLNLPVDIKRSEKSEEGNENG